MALVGMADGKILPVMWFERFVNSEVYLEQALKGTEWPAVTDLATKYQYWFQQDGAIIT